MNKAVPVPTEEVRRLIDESRVPNSNLATLARLKLLGIYFATEDQHSKDVLGRAMGFAS